MAIENHQLTSSWLRQASYDDQTRTLVVMTDAGRSYSFHLVPPDVVEAFVGSDSPGRFFQSLKAYAR
jgi:hypothetical protein